MDHIIDEAKNPLSLKLVLGVVLVLAVILWLVSSLWRNASLNADEINTQVMMQGDLDITAKGFGQFFSRNDELISSKIAGRIETIKLYPGDVVKQGQLIVQLSNADLDYEFLQQQDALQSLTISWLEQDLDFNQKIIDLTDDIEKTNLEIVIKEKTYDSNLKLFDKGIVSEINFLKSESDLSLAKLELKKLKRNVLSLKNQQSNKKTIHEQKLALETAKFNNIQAKIDAMQVIAPMAGVIKHIHVSKGDEISLGKPLVLIGSKQPDAAKIQFPQYFLDSLIQGMPVEMHYANETLTANISRVDPKIDNNYVTVEVSFASELATSALVDMNINAQIVIRQLKHVLYVQQPSYYQPDNPYLYVLKNKTLRKTAITAEAEANNYIIVRAGVTAGDEILISNHQELSKHTELDILR